jgi:hypothetical protein
MEFMGWIAMHWIDLLQTASIVVGLYATTHTIRADTKERKIQNLFTLTSAHRDLWTQFLDRPEVHRVYSVDLDLEKAPPTMAERRFVGLMILHVRTAFKARRAGMEFGDDMVAADLRQFFSRPIPRVVWNSLRELQDPEFVAFLDEILE